MFTKKDRKIANQKAKIKNRDEFIEKMSIDCKQHIEERDFYKQTTREQRETIEEANDLIKRILALTEINTYGNEKAVLDKIKELVNDYQSQH